MSRRKRASTESQTSRPGAAESGSVVSAWLPPAVTAALVVAWLAWTAYKFHAAGVRFFGSSWAGLFDVFVAAPRVLGGGLGLDLVLVAGFWLVFAGLGRALASLLGLPGLSRLEDAYLHGALGAGGASMLLLGLGLAGFWRPLLLQALFFGALAGCVAAWLRRRWAEAGALGGPRRPPDVPNLEQKDRNASRAAAQTSEISRSGPSRAYGSRKFGTGSGIAPAEAAALILLGLAVALNVLATACPEIFYDSLVYHLALPKLYLLRGRIGPTPENVYSGIPFVVQMLFGPALALRGENLAALLHCSFGAGTALGLWLWARRFASARAGVLAALLFALCPVSLYASWNCGVDLGASFFAVAALNALCIGLEPGRALPAAVRWAVCAGLLAGLAMGTKYNVFPVGAAMVAVHWWLGRRAGRPVRHTLWMGLAAAAALAPWFLKNAAFYGNPVYPFLHKVVGWTAPADWKGFMEAAGSRPPGQVFGSWAGFKDTLTFPWRVSLSDWPMGDWPGPAFLLLAPWALLLDWRSPSSRRPSGAPAAWTAAAALGVAALVSWCAASTLFRYLLPGLPFIALAAALAVEGGTFPRWLRRLGWLAALLACGFDLQVAYQQGQLIGHWSFLEGRLQVKDYLARQRVTYGLPYYAATEYVNKNLPKDAKVLFVGESRAFYCERDFIAATVYDDNPFWTSVGAASDGADLARRVRSLGATHILLSARQLLYRKDSPNVFPQELARKPAFSEFWRRYLKPLFEDRSDEKNEPRWLAVYEVLQEPGEGNASEPVKAVLDYLDKTGGNQP